MVSIDKRKFFAFTPAIIRDIAQRQQYKCAVCGRNLGAGNKTTLANYHHVVPVQAANPANPEHAFVKTADNGVLVCDESEDSSRSESCHGMVAHGDSKFADFAAHTKHFPFSHGNDKAAHKTWVRSLAQRSRSVWG